MISSKKKVAIQINQNTSGKEYKQKQWKAK